ncbi:hypothetical protein CBM2599_B51221 [Cupriavidus taiwanensis]|nr:hypothetical protein CBM2599_B51221 [Cupriavidus taiwanensis]SOZ00205.1 hypothetical protein CBM2600_B70231 [Cupriavidus taiwanensis]
MTAAVFEAASGCHFQWMSTARLSQIGSSTSGKPSVVERKAKIQRTAYGTDDDHRRPLVGPYTSKGWRRKLYELHAVRPKRPRHY